MSETWTERFDRIEECYTPGDTMPPVKDQWRFRRKEFYWKVYITDAGEKGKKYAPMKTDVRPVIKGDVVGIGVNHNGSEPSWVFVKFSILSIEKYIVKTRYRLVSDDDEGVLIEYKDDDPIRVADNDEW